MMEAKIAELNEQSYLVSLMQTQTGWMCSLYKFGQCWGVGVANTWQAAMEVAKHYAANRPNRVSYTPPRISGILPRGQRISVDDL